MRRFPGMIARALAAFLLLAPASAKGQNVPDSLRYAALDSLLSEFYTALQTSSIEDKEAECDFLISSCKDSLTRQHVAINIYSHYVEAPVMGEEELAIYVFDKWFANRKVAFTSDIDFLNARIFAEFNRSSMIGMEAPQVTLLRPDGSAQTIPAPGRTSVIFFYGTSCSKCKAITPFIEQILGKVDFEMDFYAVCTDSDAERWEKWRKEKFQDLSPMVSVHHLWDPEIDSDYQKLWGIMSTPKLYLVDPQLSIMGRRLEPESLAELLPYAKVVQEVFDRLMKQNN